MARHTFGGSLTDWTIALGDVATAGSGATGPAALVQRGATISFWSTQSGGTQYTDLLDSTGVAISTITSDATTGEIPAFSGPDGVPAMWADAGAGRQRILATDIGDVAESLLDRVADLEAQVTDIYAKLTNCLRFVLQNSDGTWPDLPSTVGDASAAWLELYDTGGQPPLNDGTHARSDRDVLLGP